MAGQEIEENRQSNLNPTMAKEAPQPDKKDPAVKRQYVSFMFFKVDPMWRRLPASEREQGKKEFMAVVEEYTRDKQILVYGYSTVGTRGDCDFMLWRISYSLEAIQDRKSVV